MQHYYGEAIENVLVLRCGNNRTSLVYPRRSAAVVVRDDRRLVTIFLGIETFNRDGQILEEPWPPTVQNAFRHEEKLSLERFGHEETRRLVAQ